MSGAYRAPHLRRQATRRRFDLGRLCHPKRIQFVPFFRTVASTSDSITRSHPLGDELGWWCQEAQEEDLHVSPLPVH